MINEMVQAPPLGAIETADVVGLQVTAVQTAMELDLFTVIASGHHQLDGIAAATHCSPHGMRVLLDALCPIGLLDKEYDVYTLTPTSETYLVRGNPAYCLPIYLAWLQNRARFTEFVRTGRPGLDLTSPDAEALWVAYTAPMRLQWPELVAAARKQWLTVGVTPETFPAARILDLGCGAGYKSFSLLLNDPHAHVTALDHPGVLEIAEEIASDMGVSHQVTCIPGTVDDICFNEPFDIVLLGSLLHYYADTAAIALLAKLKDTLQPQGMVVVNAKMVDNERRTSDALLSAIDVSNCAPDASHRTVREYQALLEAAGLRELSQPSPTLMFGRNVIL